MRCSTACAARSNGGAHSTQCEKPRATAIAACGGCGVSAPSKPFGSSIADRHLRRERIDDTVRELLADTVDRLQPLDHPLADDARRVLADLMNRKDGE